MILEVSQNVPEFHQPCSPTEHQARTSMSGSEQQPENLIEQYDAADGFQWICPHVKALNS